MIHPSVDTFEVCKITVNEHCSIQVYSERVTYTFISTIGRTSLVGVGVGVPILSSELMVLNNNLLF